MTVDDLIAEAKAARANGYPSFAIIGLADEVERLRSVEAEQSARIASLQEEIGKWAVAYNELHERITTARLALRRARFNPMETT